MQKELYTMWSSMTFFLLSILFSTFIYILVCTSTPVFLTVMFHCMAYHILFVHLPVDGHLSYFYLLAIIDSVPMNICIQFFFL